MSDCQEEIIFLISGYSEHLLLGKDVLCLIKAFYTKCPFNTMTLNTFVLYQDDLKLFNISSQKKYAVKQTKSIGVIPECRTTINHCSIPSFIENRYSAIFQQYDNNSLWSMMFAIESISSRPKYSSECTLTTFHRNLISSNQCIPYTFYLPNIPFPVRSKYNTNLPNISTRMIYSQSQQILFAMRSKDSMRMFYRLDFKVKTQSDWKWEKMSCNTWSFRDVLTTNGVSLCMVDNDTFIAFLGGSNRFYGGNDANLYAINCNKSIKLKNMNKNRRNAKSIYHDKFHKIIVCGDNCKLSGIEWYDINKNEWIMIKNEIAMRNTNDIYISEGNPNILFIVGSDCNGYLVEIHQIDLRTSNIESVKIYHNGLEYKHNACFLCL